MRKRDALLLAEVRAIETRITAKIAEVSGQVQFLRGQTSVLIEQSGEMIEGLARLRKDHDDDRENRT